MQVSQKYTSDLEPRVGPAMAVQRTTVGRDSQTTRRHSVDTLQPGRGQITWNSSSLSRGAGAPEHKNKRKKWTAHQIFLLLTKSLRVPGFATVPVQPTVTRTVPPSSICVIGAGQMRTGTTSLKQALELLYARPCYHMSLVAYGFNGTHISRWIEALHYSNSGGSGHVGPGRSFWSSIYQGFASAVDYPTCLFYKQLMSVYPKAKVILTIKDPDDWVQSCRATILSKQMLSRPTIGERLYHKFRHMDHLPELHHLMFKRAFGEHYDSMTDEELRQAYIRWNEQVISTCSPERLLIFHPKQGWAPLCTFLGVPQPPPDVPFPHVNTRTEMAEVLSRQCRTSSIINRLLGVGCVILTLVYLFCTLVFGFTYSNSVV